MLKGKTMYYILDKFGYVVNELLEQYIGTDNGAEYYLALDGVSYRISDGYTQQWFANDAEASIHNCEVAQYHGIENCQCGLCK